MVNTSPVHEVVEELPLVTVAMPVYNAGKYLRLAVLSIVKQTFTCWELLIIDDGSTDDALKSIEDINDARIRILRDGKNKGLAARLNECIDLARGQYLARMDQDDVSFPERFEYQVRALQCDPLLDLVAVRTIIISTDNQFIGWLPYLKYHEEITAKPWMGFYLPHPTWMGKTNWFRKYKYASYYCEEQELLWRSYEKSRFKAIPEPLFAYRIRDKINRKKLFKTRLIFIKIQLLIFFHKGQIYFSLMSIIAFFARLITDILKPASFSTLPKNYGDYQMTQSKWQHTIDYIDKIN